MKNYIYYLIPVVLMGVLTGCLNKRTTTNLNFNLQETDSTNISLLQDTIRPLVNFYIENSGSMDGYVKGVTEFEQAIYNYLSDIKISKAADKINLYYINSKIIPQGTVSEDMEVLKDFIENMEPSTFMIKGGNRQTSDIAGIINSVLQTTGDHTVSLLVTDGIFSPGKKDAAQYLINQQIEIKNHFAVFLDKRKDAAVLIYKLSSNFNGAYYNKIDTRITINEQRPFYIWLIGSVKNLIDLRRAVPESKFKGSGVQNVFSITTANRQVNYAINPSVGRFVKSRKDTQTTIESLERDKRTGQVRFAVNVDFSDLLLDDAYLLNADNYENNSNYDLEIEPCGNAAYTHTLYFTSDKVYKGMVSVKLLTKIPDWLDAVNDDNGSTAVKDKTYGIKYQIAGVFEAFTDKNKQYAEIKINIK